MDSAICIVKLYFGYREILVAGVLDAWILSQVIGLRSYEIILDMRPEQSFLCFSGRSYCRVEPTFRRCQDRISQEKLRKYFGIFVVFETCGDGDRRRVESEEASVRAVDTDSKNKESKLMSHLEGSIAGKSLADFSRVVRRIFQSIGPSRECLLIQVKMFTALQLHEELHG